MLPQHDFKAAAHVCGRCGARYGQCEHTEVPKPVDMLNRTGRNAPPWTEGEEDLLIDLYCIEGMSIGGIATRLARSKSAVVTRLYDLGLRAEDQGRCGDQAVLPSL